MSGPKRGLLTLNIGRNASQRQVTLGGTIKETVGHPIEKERRDF